MMRRKYSLRGNFLELLTDWDAAAQWADLCLLPYIKIGDGETRVARINCYYGAPAPPPGEGAPQSMRIHMGLDAVGYKVNGRLAEVRTAAGVVYQLADNTIEIFYPEKTEDALRDPSRLCREILYNSLPVGSWFEWHAAAVARNEKALIFIGQKGTGKTTTICHLLSGTGWGKPLDFVSNDRVWINLSDAPLNVIGSPMPICPGYGTMAAVPQLASRLSLFRDYAHLLNKNWTMREHEYTTKEFARFFQCDINPEAVAVAAIGLKPGTSNLLRPVETNARKLEVIKSGDRNSNRNFPNWIGIGHSPAEREFDLIELDRLSCPIYELEFTPGEGAAGKCAETIMATLGELLS
jgi:hypothetical protein